MGQCASSSGSKEGKSPREHRKEAKEVVTRGYDAKPGEKADHGQAGHVVSDGRQRIGHTFDASVAFQLLLFVPQNAQAVRAGRARVLDDATPVRFSDHETRILTVLKGPIQPDSQQH